MCRVLAYLGEPIPLADVLFETDSSLVRQSYSPRMMATFLNLAGFGMVAWDPHSVRAEQPFAYRVATLRHETQSLRHRAHERLMRAFLDPRSSVAAYRCSRTSRPKRRPA